MPTFTAIAFDRLIEPGASKSMAPVITSPDPKLERTLSSPSSRRDRGINSPSSKVERGVSLPPNPSLERKVVSQKPKLESRVGIPPNPKLARILSAPPNPKLDRGNSVLTTTTSAIDKNNHWTQISPALYATPESTPLPDSPSSFTPSPYIINHKRRGPRLMKSFSEDDVATRKEPSDEIKEEEANVSKDDTDVPVQVLDYDDNKLSGLEDVKGNSFNGVSDVEVGSGVVANGSAGQNGLTKCVAFNLQQDGDIDDFVDPQDSMSVKSFGGSEGNGGAERFLNSETPMSEFFDAWEELSSPQFPMRDIENELSEIRLSLLLEIEKRKKAEENLKNMRNQWQKIREQLSVVGLTLPVDPTTLPDGTDPAAEVCQQVYLARFISNSIGRGIAKAEVEMEMEAQLKLKNSEIARLWDRLHYYEAVNQEMSQRNQEVIETTRRLRQRRKRRQRWVWGSIATAFTIGSAVLAYSYFHTGKGSSSPGPTQVSDVKLGN